MFTQDFYKISERRPRERSEIIWIETDSDGNISVQVGEVGYYDEDNIPDLIVNGVLLHSSGVWAYTTDLVSGIDEGYNNI